MTDHELLYTTILKNRCLYERTKQHNIMRQLSNWLARRTVTPIRKACRFESYLAHQIPGEIHMGVSPLRSCSSYVSPSSVKLTIADPVRFTVRSEQLIGDYLIVHVNYPDAHNYEGNKIMVYHKVASVADILKINGELDPHFSDKQLSPIARFEPTEHGMYLCKKFVESLCE